MVDVMGSRQDRFAPGLRDLIIECATSSELIELHADDQQEDRFYCGRVIEVAEHGFRLEYVDPLGAPGSNGVPDAWFDFVEIGFIRRNTAYLRGLAKLMPVHEQFTSMPRGKYRRKLKGIRKLLKEGAEAGWVVTITLEDSNYNVWMKSADDSVAYGVIVADDGGPEGDLAIRYDHVQRARRGSWEAAVEWLVR